MVPIGGEVVGPGISSKAGGGGGFPLTKASGQLANDYNFTGSLATFLTTSSLAAGVWDVTFSGTIGAAGGQDGDIVVNLGTATATFEGQTSGSFEGSGTVNYGILVLRFIVTITVAGTLVFQAQASSGAPSFRAKSQFFALGHATAWVATKIG